MAHATPLKLIIFQNSLTLGTQKNMLELWKLCKPCCFNKVKWIKENKPKSTRKTKNNTYAKIIKTQTPIFSLGRMQGPKECVNGLSKKKPILKHKPLSQILIDLEWLNSCFKIMPCKDKFDGNFVLHWFQD
jgi:hypothetical protein